VAIKSRLIAQFRRPTGVLGRLAGSIMAARPSNRLRNRRTIELLALDPDDLVLEIGYGPGFAIALASRLLSGGKVIGLDHSEVMHRQAVNRNASGIAAGVVELHVGDISSPPCALPLVDKIYSVNVVQFWPDPERVFAALRRLLRPGGRVATTFMPRLGKDKQGQALARARDLERLMEQSGFAQIETHWLDLRPAPAFCIVAGT